MVVWGENCSLNLKLHLLWLASRNPWEKCTCCDFFFPVSDLELCAVLQRTLHSPSFWEQPSSLPHHYLFFLGGVTGDRLLTDCRGFVAITSLSALKSSSLYKSKYTRGKRNVRSKCLLQSIVDTLTQITICF